MKLNEGHNLEEKLAQKAVGRGKDQLALLPRLKSGFGFRLVWRFGMSP